MRKKSRAMSSLLCLMYASPALASFHLWDISEIYSNEDGTVQFIELFTSSNSQQFTIRKTIRTSQGAATKDFVFPANTPSPTAGRFLLLATAGFVNQPGAVTPDFTLEDGFLFTPDGVVDFLSANSLTYDCLPVDGTLSLHCDANNGTSCTATSIDVNSPTNFAGVSGSLGDGGDGCLDTDNDAVCDVCDACAGGAASGDANADGQLSVLDLAIFELCLHLSPDGPGCECFDFNADSDVDLKDFAEFQRSFGDL